MRKGVFVEIILIILGIVSIAYFFGLSAYIGFSTKFVFFWALLGAALIAAALILRHIRINDINVPGALKAVLAVGLIAFAFLFAVVEGTIISNAVKQPQKGADYVLVLGAKVNGTVPSLSLMYRINKAYDYLVENENTKAIVCGGKGNDENISEAEAMKNSLIAKGIDESRIIVEDKSTSTKENIEFAMKLMDSPDSSVVVTTNSYHVFRAVGIAQKAGLKTASGNPAGCVWRLIPQDFTREFFAVIKDFLVGNI
ncbi:MAG: YdcF family protein [Lachnospiraceae bacterium]|nr:YdcF family protein [Lachnospiraceae bacterium]